MGEKEKSNDCCYERYCEMGGIINEHDYKATMVRAEQIFHLDRCLVLQAERAARVAGFSLNNDTNRLDKVTVLYGVLRTDENPGAPYHHGQMCDQRLFAEALRMSDRPDLLEKVIKAYPNIDFD
jgi:hypothetical protein